MPSSHSDINLIDIEASGLHCESYPIEIAVHVNGKLSAWLIRPQPGWTHWDPDAEALHGLSYEQLMREGKSAGFVASELNRILSGVHNVVHSDAASWDSEWLNTLYMSTGVKQAIEVRPIEDRLVATALERFTLKLEELQEAREAERHRAAADVSMILDAYRWALAIGE